MERLPGDPSKDAADELIEQLERESVVSLNGWRHDLVTQLDNWLFLSEELDTLERHGSKMTQPEQQAHYTQLLARAREYMQFESKQLEPRLTRYTPVRVRGKLLWHTYNRHGKLVTEALPPSCEITGQYIDCDVAPYYSADAMDDNRENLDAYYREIGVHMMIYKPLIASRHSGRMVATGIDYMFVPLHYDTADFAASYVAE